MKNNEFFKFNSELPKPLEKQELYKLLNEVKNGNQDAKKTVIEHNLRLVLYYVSDRFSTVDYDQRDLVSIGNIGLIKAIDTFDISKNIEFATYATRCINNEILMFLRNLKKDKVVDSLNKPINIDYEGNKLKLEDILHDGTNLDEEYATRDVYIFIRNLVANLPDKDREIIIMYFGFFNDQTFSQKEISERLNISQSYVSRIIKRILKQIKISLISNGFFEERTINKKVKQKM